MIRYPSAPAFLGVLGIALSACASPAYEMPAYTPPPEPPALPVAVAPGGEADWGLLAQLAGSRWLYEQAGIGVVTRYEWDVPGATMRQTGRVLGGDTVAHSTFHYVPGRRGIEVRTYMHTPGISGYAGSGVLTVVADGVIEMSGSAGGYTTSGRMWLDSPDRLRMTSSSVDAEGKTVYPVDVLYVRITDAEEHALAAAYTARQQQMAQQDLGVAAADALRAQGMAEAERGADFLEWAITALTIIDVLSDPTGQSYNAFISQNVPELAPLAEAANIWIRESERTARTGTAASGGAVSVATGRGRGAGAVAPGSYAARDNILRNEAACAGYTVENYQAYFERNANGTDVQLHTMCAAAYNYYAMYLNAIRQGYAEADANVTYGVYLDAATVAIDFYEGTRTR